MDTITPLRRSKNMRRIKSENTRPELSVRRLIYHLGFRYRVHYQDLPGKPDIVFPRRKKAIFVHGCFWHQHQTPTCRYVHLPKSRLDYWLPKLQRTQQRDASYYALLTRLGWKHLIVWECDLDDLQSLTTKLKDFLS